MSNVVHFPRYTATAIRIMHDAHLINALLKCLSVADSPEDVTLLAVEVKRRGLESQAYAEAKRRQP